MTSDGKPQQRRGEIWVVNLDPTIGDEIKKTRPCLVIDSDGIGKLRTRLIAPVTEWKHSFQNNLWHVRVDPEKSNGLIKASAIDVLQLRAVDTQRFIKKCGYISAPQMEEVVAAIAIVIEYS